MFIREENKGSLQFLSSMLDSMQRARSAITLRFLGESMMANGLKMTIEEVELLNLLIAKMPAWLKGAKTRQDYAFLANAMAGVANLAVIAGGAHTAAARQAFGQWKELLRSQKYNLEARDLLAKVEKYESRILDQARPDWDQISS